VIVNGNKILLSGGRTLRFGICLKLVRLILPSIDITAKAKVPYGEV
jgi:hypothetical protein